MSATYTFTRSQLYRTLCEAISMAREFEARHGHSAADALADGAQEIIDGLDAERDLIAHGEMDADKAGQVLA